MDKTAEQIADFLIDQRDEPWPGGTESDRLHYWREKAITAARGLKALSARPAVGEDVVERVQDMLVAAYKAGATAVHNSWVEGTNGSEPDFYEAASDYAHAAIAAITGEGA